MAVLKIVIPEQMFTEARAPEEIAEEVRMAVLMFWLARGTLRREGLSTEAPGMRVTVQSLDEQTGHVEPLTPPVTGAQSQGFMDFLRSMPDVDDDSIFDRIREYPREQPKWDI